MDDELKVTDGVVDAAYLLNQVAEHLELTASDLEIYISQIQSNPWRGESKELFLRALSSSKDFHNRLREVSADLIDAVITMMTNYDTTMQNLDDIAELGGLY
jgi:PPE-repeat protein